MTSRLRAGLIFDVALLGLALLVAAEVYGARRERPLLLAQKDWDQLVSSDRMLGPSSAKVTLVEFTDYQCPACSSIEPVLDGIQREYPTSIRRIIRHFPIPPLHPEARFAALGVECAAEQGRFATMHGLTFKSQQTFGSTPWDSLARLAGVPELDRFRSCMASTEAAQRIDSDHDLGARLGVTGTPTLLVDREWLQGFNAASLRQLLQARLR